MGRCVFLCPYGQMRVCCTFARSWLCSCHLQEMNLRFSSEAAGVDMGNTLYNFRKAKSGAKAKEEMKVCVHAYPAPLPPFG
jgi:hypothetical protein